MANYRETASMFADHLSGLDPAIARALSDYLHVGRPHAPDVSISQPLSSVPQKLEKNTDVLQFHLGTDATIDLDSLAKKDVNGLEAIVFTSDTNVALNLGSFTGAVILGDGDNSVVATKEVAIQTGLGDDTVTTGSGHDTVVTGGGDDHIVTNGGDDLVYAGLGNDSVDTGVGNDTVHTGFGNDSISLGEGNDKVVIEARDGDVIHVDGGKGKDAMDLTGVTIESVAKVTAPGPDFGYYQITVETAGGGHATVVLTNVESFIYDANGAAAGGTTTVDLGKLDHDF